ncbi:unnamed protein product, partial [marine sediment metagenome]
PRLCFDGMAGRKVRSLGVRKQAGEIFAVDEPLSYDIGYHLQ